MNTTESPRDCPARRLYGRIVAEIPSPELVPSRHPGTDWAAELARLSDEELVGAPVLDPLMVSAVRSGLLLRADLLDEAHHICQRLASPAGSYWHGIMHRREGDFGNSKYWLHRVGPHEIFSALAAQSKSETDEAASRITRRGDWDPFLHIDLCESCHATAADPLEAELKTIQEIEIQLLLEHCCHCSTGR